MNLTFTDREKEVVDMVSKACGGLNLETTAVDVQKLEGGTVPTLRFTLEDRASTDLERQRIEADEDTQSLARVVVQELARQMGPPR
jgi:hypothetical protein